MSRFICVVGEDPEIMVCDDEKIVQEYSDEEWFLCFDTQTGTYFKVGEEGAITPKDLPHLEEKEFDSDEY